MSAARQARNRVAQEIRIRLLALTEAAIAINESKAVSYMILAQRALESREATPHMKGGGRMPARKKPWAKEEIS